MTIPKNPHVIEQEEYGLEILSGSTDSDPELESSWKGDSGFESIGRVSTRLKSKLQQQRRAGIDRGLTAAPPKQKTPRFIAGIEVGGKGGLPPKRTGKKDSPRLSGRYQGAAKRSPSDDFEDRSMNSPASSPAPAPRSGAGANNQTEET
jgi:hypothetical protein